jgi:hypothetical protein
MMPCWPILNDSLRRNNSARKSTRYLEQTYEENADACLLKMQLARRGEVKVHEFLVSVSHGSDVNAAYNAMNHKVTSSGA